jgi:DNA-binding NtrC family response regulator
VVLNHHWPGNMRELITVLKRAAILLESPITGDNIKEIIYGSGYKKSHADGERWLEEIRDDLKKGRSFWEVVKQPFLNRDLNRQQVKKIITEALAKTNGNYKDTLKILNIDEDDYVKFMKFLYRNELN